MRKETSGMNVRKLVVRSLVVFALGLLLIAAVAKYDVEQNREAQLYALHVPLAIRQGCTVAGRVILRNNGADWIQEQHYVALGMSEPVGWHSHRPPASVQLLTPEAKSDQSDAFDRLMLPMPWKHGEERVVYFLLRAVGPKGPHVVMFQPVKEGVWWFGESRRITITII